MGRGPHGFSAESPLLAAIEQDPLLSQLCMIAEPWDVGHHGYRLGSFPARYLEWNDRYRDDVRRFWRGEPQSAGALATRLAGSSDIFGRKRMPSRSVNYVAAHDGFTLKDAVTYREKNNFANGEDNRDGNAHEPTWPRGDARALLATLFLSRGTPMLAAGDEIGRSQKGNNNAYAQDNNLTWLDWESADNSLMDLVAQLAKLRRNYPVLARDRFFSEADAEWCAPDGRPIDWHDPGIRSIGLIFKEEDARYAIWINGSGQRVSLKVPAREGHRWLRVFSSAKGSALPPRSVSFFLEERLRKGGISDATLAVLAGLAGVERDWWEVDGTHHRVPPDTLRAVLTALRLPHASPDDAATSRRLLSAPPHTLAGREGQPIPLGDPDPRRRCVICSSAAGEYVFRIAPGDKPTVTLPPGLYDLHEEGAPSRRLIVAPQGCYLPPDIAAGARAFGLFAHLYALRHEGDGGIGDFETLRRFVELTVGAGGRFTGLNPLHHLFPADRTRRSPYQPSDRRFVDPIYINIPSLLASFDLPKTRKLAERHRAAFARLAALPAIDYREVWEAKSALLKSAFREFRRSPAFESFVKTGGEALVRHGAFEAKQAGDTSRAPSRIRYHAFLQWIAETQLGEAARHGTLYRDLALGCAFDGGEIMEEPENFAEGVSLGAPPDPFSQSGQIWNLPPFSPHALDAQGFAPFLTILDTNMRHAAALRIDHILGFARQFWVPRGAEGKDGAYVRFPTNTLLAATALLSHRHRCLVIGEDLGTVPEGLRAALAAENVLSYRVLWFEREGALFRPPTDYPRLALACLTSHDLPTYAGWRAARDIAIAESLGHISAERAAAGRGLRQTDIAALDRLAGSGSVACHRMLASTPSAIMMVQADDLAGEIDPINVPGTDKEYPNWRRRISVSVERLLESGESAKIIEAVRQERA
jgi:glycogen operon protein